ncbi:ABC transporter permease [Roseixanthobacter liquoris]|uniref:ABC transporter permease n=1 Tax=Roseixanthobacter liquoris TaxID=3119921 RepID=UPI00372A4161
MAKVGSQSIYLILPVIIIGLWQLASMRGWVQPYLLPAPTTVAAGFYEITVDGTLAYHLMASLFRSLTGFFIATIIAVPLGILIGWFRLVHKVTQITLLMVIPIPITAWISFSILWFGIGDKSAIFLVALGAAVPILINTVHGVEWVDRLYIEAARTLGTGPRAILWRVVLPAALPNIFTGLRIGLRNSWAGLVVAEMIGAKSGIGYLIWDSRLMMRSDLMIVGMLLVGVLGLLSDQAMAAISRRVLSWHEGRSND